MTCFGIQVLEALGELRVQGQCILEGRFHPAPPLKETTVRQPDPKHHKYNAKVDEATRENIVSNYHESSKQSASKLKDMKLVVFGCLRLRAGKGGDFPGANKAEDFSKTRKP